MNGDKSLLFNMPLDQTTQAKPETTTVSSGILVQDLARKRSCTAAIREDERPQGAEHNQKRANTAETDVKMAGIGGEMAEIEMEIAKWKRLWENVRKDTVEETPSTGKHVQKQTKTYRTVKCCVPKENSDQQGTCMSRLWA